MKQLGCLLLCVVLPVLVCSGETSQPRALTLEEYRAELARLLAVSSRLPDAGHAVRATADALPAVWRIRAADGNEFRVPTSALRRDLWAAVADKGSADTLARVRERVNRLVADLDAYEAAPENTARQHEMLSAILARREFSAVHGPSWLDRLKWRISEALLNLLGHIIGSSRISTIASTVVFMLVGLALLVTAVWIYRTLGGRQTPTLVPEVCVSAKEWTIWLREAREAASAGQWRDAVRLAYWAGVSRLESQRVWPPDRARTPREYLRLLPAASEHHAPLSTLTRTFERVWYGGRGADMAAFAETIGELEKLGCSLPR